MDLLDEEETRLASSLRDVCTPLMDEKRSKLIESTEILHHMGLLYLKKAAITQDMDQKLNFIKAATLLHAARARSEKFLKNHLRTTIFDALNDLETLVIEKSSGTLSVSLSEISNRVFSAFEFYRKEEEKSLNLLGTIKESSSECEVERKWREKTEIIQKIMVKNSQNYIKQMQNIANDCLGILGSPPSDCDFAIVGLGSLARDEVTLYSDFEHVILLKDGVEDREDYARILEYFRWFSIVFHIIVIGMGETIIPSVGVESLNDFYTDDKSKNWFYDSFTPSGVSFDGMMPHACKIPIGRQKKTSDKDFILELIQPVSQMAKYLTKEEDMVNEYYLKDVLCETCFVYGSGYLFVLFKEKAEHILEMEEERNSFPSLSQAAGKNRNQRVREIGSFHDDTVDPKVEFYRPLSVFIGYVGREQGIDGKSGLDKVSLINGIKLLKDTKSLEWAFAVACEIRVKGYATNYGNRSKMGKNILEHVGVPCLLNCASAISDLCLHFKSLYHADELQKFVGAKLTVLMFLQKYGEAKKLIFNLLEQVSFIGTFSNMIILYKQILARIYLIEAEAFPDSKQECFQKAESSLLEIKSCHDHYRICLLLSTIYNRQGRFEQAWKLANVALELLKQQEFQCSEMLEVQSVLIQAARSCCPPVGFLSFCIDFLTINRDIVSKLVLGCAIAEAKCEIGEKDEARLILKRLAELWGTEAPRSLSLSICQTGIAKVTSKQESQGWFDDCVESYELFEDILRPGRDVMDYDLLMRHKAELYVKASSFRTNMQEKIKLCEKAINICHTYQHKETFHTICCSAVNAILEYSVSYKIQDFDPFKLWRIFKELPHHVRDDIDVKATSGRCFIKSLAMLHQAKDVGPVDIWHKVKYTWLIMHTPHPYLYPYLRDLLAKVNNHLYNMFGQPLDLDGVVNYHRKVNVSKPINFLWRAMFLKNLVSETAILKFASQLYRFMSMKAYLQFFEEVDSLPHRLSLRQDFVNAIYSYIGYNFPSAIDVFWRTILREDKNSHLQRLSIIFLCNSVVYFLIEKRGFHFYHDYFKRQISAGPIKIVKTLNANWLLNIQGTPMGNRMFNLPEKVENEVSLHSKERFL